MRTPIAQALAYPERDRRRRRAARPRRRRAVRVRRARPCPLSLPAASPTTRWRRAAARRRCSTPPTRSRSLPSSTGRIAFTDIAADLRRRARDAAGRPRRRARRRAGRGRGSAGGGAGAPWHPLPPRQEGVARWTSLTKLLAFLVDPRRPGRLPRARPLPRRPLVRRQGDPVLGGLRARGVVAAVIGPTGTEWALSAVPLGGYVKMADEREGRGRGGGPSARLQPAGGLAAHRDRRRRADRQPAARGAAVRRHLRRRRAGPTRDRRDAAGRHRGRGDRAARGRPRHGRRRRGRCGAGRTCAGGCSAPPARTRSSSTLQRDDGSTTRTPLALSAVPSADWEGNFMSVLGLKADFGPPLIDEAVPDKPAARAGLQGGRPHRRHRRRARCARRPTSPRRRTPSPARDRRLPRRSRRRGVRHRIRHRGGRARRAPYRARRRPPQGRSGAGRPPRRHRALRRLRSARRGPAQDRGTVGLHAAACSAAS